MYDDASFTGLNSPQELPVRLMNTWHERTVAKKNGEKLLECRLLNSRTL